MNGSSLVSERLSKRVWQAIKQLNYLPNRRAFWRRSRPSLRENLICGRSGLRVLPPD